MILTDCGRPDNPIIATNPAFTRVTGYAVGDAVGRRCRFLQGEDRDQPEAAVLRAAVPGRDTPVASDAARLARAVERAATGR